MTHNVGIKQGVQDHYHKDDQAAQRPRIYGGTSELNGTIFGIRLEDLGNAARLFIASQSDLSHAHYDHNR